MNRRKRNNVIILTGIIAILLVIGAAVGTILILSGTGTNGYQRQMTIAAQHLASGNYDEAITACYAAIDLAPEDDEAYLTLADIYERQGDEDRAAYILDLGYRNTNSARIFQRLQAPLTDPLGTIGQGSTEKVPLALNRSLMVCFAEYRYADMKEKFGEAVSVSIDREERFVNHSMVLQRADFSSIGISCYYADTSNGIYENGRPVEIHVGNLSMLISGLKDTLTYQELSTMDVKDLTIESLADIGTVVKFRMLGCIVYIACDEQGTIHGTDAWNAICPSQPMADQGSVQEELFTAEAQVLNAVNGKAVRNAHIIFYQGSAAVAEGYTDGNGYYQAEDLPVGEYRVEIDADGYVSEQQSFYVTEYEDAWKIDFALSPELETGEIRLVLTWDELPSDLDSYLFHEGRMVYYHDREMTDASGAVIAALDMDDTDGYGPETITLQQTAGTFEYIIADYWVTGILGTTNATVKIYVGNDPPITVQVPSDVRNIWRVCTIIDGQVHVDNVSGDEIGYSSENGIKSW